MSFLSTLKRFKFLLAVFFILGCQNLRTREDVRQLPTPTRHTAPSVVVPSVSSPQQVVTEVVEPEPAPEAVKPPPPPVIPSLPKIGIILGAGGAKAYAHIGFLQELGRARIPVHAIGGIEFAAPMAALFANREQVNEVEWQMFKMKDETVLKKSLLGVVHTNNEVTELKSFFSEVFGRARIEDARLHFACPSYNLKKNQVYLMNKGGVDQLMYLCMAYPPYFKPYQNSISGVRDVTAMANYLRSKGANHIVLVNVLQAPGVGKSFTAEASGTDNVLWSEISGLYNKPFLGVDTVVSLETSKYGIMDFEKRREIMNKGAESAARQIKALTRKLGL